MAVAARWRFHGIAWIAVLLIGCSPEAQRGPSTAQPVPVEIAPVERGTIEDARVFTGTLEAFSELPYAARIAGRIDRVNVDLGDQVAAGDVLVTLIDDEHRQAVKLAQADVAVAKAQQIEAVSMLETTARELARVEQLHGQGLMSETALDASRSAERAAAAARERAHGALARAEAQLATARIRLADTRARAGPLEGGGTRLVAERHVDPGDTVVAGSPLVTTVEIDPLIAVISVTEEDYMRIAIGQRATLTTDALVGRSFEAKVQRIAPRFDEASRQARIELRVDNGQLELKPGLFVRATLVLGSAADATIVPEAALTRRAGRDGIFVVQSDRRVAFTPVEVGIRNRGRVEVRGQNIAGDVVTLGQQLLSEDSIIDPRTAAPSTGAVEGPPVKREGSRDG